jgi:tetratricopeptide (TPR) repeat protein
MKFKAFFLILCSYNMMLFAQEISPPAARDANVVKELFFAGLKEKLAENYANAGASFTKLLAIDAKNDAAYFELATINYRQNKLLEAETAIKKAIGLNANNSWYLKLQAEIYKRNGNMQALVLVFDQLIQMKLKIIIMIRPMRC